MKKSQKTLPIEAIDLMGQIVSANVAALAHTNNSLLEWKDQEIRELRQALVRVGGVLDGATVIDRVTESRLSTFCWPDIWAAEDALEREAQVP